MKKVYLFFFIVECVLFIVVPERIQHENSLFLSFSPSNQGVNVLGEVPEVNSQEIDSQQLSDSQSLDPDQLLASKDDLVDVLSSISASTEAENQSFVESESLAVANELEEVESNDLIENGIASEEIADAEDFLTFVEESSSGSLAYLDERFPNAMEELEIPPSESLAYLDERFPNIMEELELPPSESLAYLDERFPNIIEDLEVPSSENLAYLDERFPNIIEDLEAPSPESLAYLEERFPRVDDSFSAREEESVAVGDEALANSELPYYFDPAFTPADTGNGLLTAASEAQGTPPAVQPKKPNSFPWPKRLQLTHSEENGVGNKCGYSSADLLVGPSFVLGKLLPLLDIGGAVFNDGTYAGYAGMVFRYVPKKLGLVPGINIFYDARASHGLYQDVGVGLELLSRWVDFRINGYAPVGKSSSTKKRVCDNYIGDYAATSKAHEFEFSGGDAELGVLPLNTNGFLIYLAGGSYYLHSKYSGNIWGWQGRIQPQYRDFLALRMTVSSDRLFGTIVQGEVLLSIPYYGFSSSKNNKGPGKMTSRQIYQPIERRPFVPLGNRCCWNSNF